MICSLQWHTRLSAWLMSSILSGKTLPAKESIFSVTSKMLDPFNLSFFFFFLFLWGGGGDQTDVMAIASRSRWIGSGSLTRKLASLEWNRHLWFGRMQA